MSAVYNCIYLFIHFLHFMFLAASGIKPTSTWTQGGAGVGFVVCVLAGGPLDCLQSSIFP